MFAPPGQWGQTTYQSTYSRFGAQRLLSCFVGAKAALGTVVSINDFHGDGNDGKPNRTRDNK